MIHILIKVDYNLMDLVIIKLNKVYLILYRYYITNLLFYIFSYYYGYHVDNEKIFKIFNTEKLIQCIEIHLKYEINYPLK